MGGIIDLDQRLVRLRRLRDRIDSEVRTLESAAEKRRQAADQKARDEAQRAALEEKQRRHAEDERRERELRAELLASVHPDARTDEAQRPLTAAQSTAIDEASDAELAALAPTERVRAWARGQGIAVGDRGRIKADIRRAYLNATGGTP